MGPYIVIDLLYSILNTPFLGIDFTLFDVFKWSLMLSIGWAVVWHFLIGLIRSS